MYVVDIQYHWDIWYIQYTLSIYPIYRMPTVCIANTVSNSQHT